MKKLPFGTRTNAPKSPFSRYGESQATTGGAPNAASKFGMPKMPGMPGSRGSSIPGVGNVSTRNRKSVSRFGLE